MCLHGLRYARGAHSHCMFLIYQTPVYVWEMTCILVVLKHNLYIWPQVLDRSLTWQHWYSTCAVGPYKNTIEAALHANYLWSKTIYLSDNMYLKGYCIFWWNLYCAQIDVTVKVQTTFLRSLASGHIFRKDLSTYSSQLSINRKKYSIYHCTMA